MNGATKTSGTIIETVATTWKIAGTGDFNGDNKADILWRKDDGSVALWQMNGAASISRDYLNPYPAIDNSWKIADTGDFNGDGKTDLLWRNDNGSIETWQMNGATVLNASLLSPSPIVSNDWQITGSIL